MTFLLDRCTVCYAPWDSAPGRPQSPYVLPCGHVLCLTCARRPTLTPATSMSVCTTCHVPYTKRDVYALDLRAYADGAKGLHVYRGGVAHSTRDATRAIEVATPSSPTSETTSDFSDGSGITIPALLQRIQDLDNAVKHRDAQIEHWRGQFDKSSQSLLVYLRDVRDLKREVMDWWRKFQAKDLEVQSLQRSLADAKRTTTPPQVLQLPTPIASPDRTYQRYSPPPPAPPHKRDLDGSRHVTLARAHTPAAHGYVITNGPSHINGHARNSSEQDRPIVPKSPIPWPIPSPSRPMDGGRKRVSIKVTPASS